MLKCQKDLFSLEPDITYLNCAYKGPLLKKSEEKIFEAIENERNPFKLKAPNYFQISNEIRREYSKIKNRQVMFEYVLLKGINDTAEDAVRLANLIQGIEKNGVRIIKHH